MNKKTQALVFLVSLLAVTLAFAYVIAAHGTRVSLIRMALQRMANSNAHLLGIVLTKFDAKQSSYGYGYEYGYDYAAARNKAKGQAA